MVSSGLHSKAMITHVVYLHQYSWFQITIKTDFLLGSSALNRLDKVLTNKRYLTDVEKLSHHYQTSTVESFHSVIQRFAPKNIILPFIGMLCRYVHSLLTSSYNKTSL